MALKKICNKAGCNDLCDRDQRYCEKHKDTRVDRKVGNRYYDMNVRDREATAFYHSVEWKKVRKLALVRDNYLCVECLANMKFSRYGVVDHILPREWFPELELDVDNLQCLCLACHNTKTWKDLEKYGKKDNNTTNKDGK